MKNFKSIFVALGLLTFGNVYAGDHGGGNGGSDLEIELQKRSLQIGHFLNSNVGKKSFPNLNPEAFINVVNSQQIDVVAEELLDKHGMQRTCLNFPKEQIIKCNAQRTIEMMKHEDIFTAMMFHETLGLMSLELGYEEDVSAYPVSSQIIPFSDVVVATPVSEKQIRPEYYGIANRSYGLTIKNRKTKETIRLICLNDNVDIHRCRNYSLVRQAGDLQAPLVPGVISLSPNDLKNVRLDAVTHDQVNQLITGLNEIKENGFKYLMLDYKTNYGGKRVYRFGTGLTQYLDSRDYVTYRILFLFFGISAIPLVVDFSVEVAKQAVNITAYPIKALIKGLKIAHIQSKINKYNYHLATATDVLNLRNDLSMVGRNKSVSDKEYNMILNALTAGVLQVKGGAMVELH